MYLFSPVPHLHHVTGPKAALRRSFRGVLRVNVSCRKRPVHEDCRPGVRAQGYVEDRLLPNGSPREHALSVSRSISIPPPLQPRRANVNHYNFRAIRLSFDDYNYFRLHPYQGGSLGRFDESHGRLVDRSAVPAVAGERTSRGRTW